MVELQNQVRLVRIRQQKQWLWQCVSKGLLVGSLAASGVAIFDLAISTQLHWQWMLSSMAACSAVGALYSLVRFKSLREAAQTIDQKCNLKDRSATALQFKQKAATQQLTEIQSLQLQDAEEHAAKINPQEVVPYVAPRSWNWAVAATVLAGILAVYPRSNPTDSVAAIEVNPVVDRQADRVEENLEELEAIQREQKDPELEELVKELKQVLEQLKEPGVDPKEALAKLSEMEASLMKMQEKMQDTESLAQLQQIGDALSLSPSMAQAGQSLSKGDMEKAAEALEKLEMPELDRQTEKAILEKLDEANKQQNNKQDGQPKSSVQQAAEQMSQGISQGNRGKFGEGSKSLAGEARKQSQKKKLTDLLKKQCQCLGECKSECESECRNQGSSPKPGGNKAGTASADKTPGEKTAQLKSGEQMKLKGQESSQGDSEVETEVGNEMEEQAVRSYAQQAGKFEALSESALESESIPLGHRQTIRKYFELIRPTTAETDKVKEKSQE
ncbi:MAG: hypothetical protein U0930_06510 [Pirellulales bacterium]